MLDLINWRRCYQASVVHLDPCQFLSREWSQPLLSTYCGQAFHRFYQIHSTFHLCKLKAVTLWTDKEVEVCQPGAISLKLLSNSGPCYSTCGSLRGNTGITKESIRKAESWPPLQTRSCVLTGSQGFWCTWQLQKL